MAATIPNGSAINIALERGEVAARTNTWASFKATSSAWLRDHKINILVQIGLIRAKDLPGVPLLTDLARNDEDRTLLKLLSAPATIGRPTVATPGLAEAKVKLLRAAFDATVADPAFLAEAERAHLEINPMSGAELETIVTEVVTAPKPLAKRLATMLDPGGSR